MIEYLSSKTDGFYKRIVCNELQIAAARRYMFFRILDKKFHIYNI